MTTTYTNEDATVEVLEPGRVIRVGPPRLTVDSVFELAEALIEERGFERTSGVPVKEARGDEQKGPFTIHRAIGEAARLASGSNAKDYGDARVLREKAAEVLAEKFGRTDIQLNDEPRCDKRRAIRILRRARGAS